MSASSTCKECGTAIPADSPGGFCAQCLFGLALQEHQSKESQSERPPAEKLGDRIGRYKLLQEIGHGGCGVVYMAEQEEPVRRRVALKVIKLGMDTKQVVARFEAERQALALMDHPNIAKVFDAGSTERPLTRPADTLSPNGGEGQGEGDATLSAGRPYFVMELVGGIKLTDYCNQNNLTIRQRLDLFVQVCRAIQHAHQKGIIHRDIKPSNVLVATHDGVPVPKVIDFGIAKATQGRLTDQTLFTAFEQFLGTPAYMSPEQTQLGSLDVDTRSDIYSLGVLLYELLTGTTPFDTKDLVAAGLDEMRRTIRDVDPVKPSTRLTQELSRTQRPLTPSLSPNGGEGVRRTGEGENRIKELVRSVRGDLDWIVMKCLEKDRARRYETANGLASDVQRHLNNEPIVARPPSKLYSFQKAVQRNKTVFSATALIAVVVVAGVVVSLWQAVRATRAEGEQSRLFQQAQVQQKIEAQLRAASDDRLYDSLFAQARNLRMARQVGYRDEALALLRRANTLNVPRRNLMALRREALACMGDFVGLQPTSFDVTTNNAVIRRTELDMTGRIAAFILSDGTIVLRELPSGREVGFLRANHPAKHVCFAPASDVVVSVHWPGEEPTPEALAKSQVRFWHRKTGEPWRETDTKPIPGALQCFANGNGTYALALDSSSRSCGLIDLSRLQQVASFPIDPIHCPTCFCAALSPDGQRLAIGAVRENTAALPATGHPQSVVELWDTRTSQRTQRWESNLGRFVSLGFSRDGRFLGCLSRAGGVIYPLAGSQLAQEFHEYFEPPSQIAFAPSQTLIALPLGQHSRVRLWDWKKNEDIAALQLFGGALEVAFAVEGKFLLNSVHRRAWLYPLEATEGKLKLGGHARAVTGVAFDPNGSRLASVGKDRAVKMWDTATGELLWESSALPGLGQTVAFSPDGTLLATGDLETRWVWVWNARTGRRLLELGTNGVGAVWSTEFSPDGRYLASATTLPRNEGGGEGFVQVWELHRLSDAAGELSMDATQVNFLRGGEIRNLRFSPDGKTAAFYQRVSPGARRWSVHRWDFRESSPSRALNHFTDEDGPQTLSFHRDGRELLLWNSDSGRLEFVNIATEEATPFLGTFADAAPPQFNNGQHSLSRDGELMATGIPGNMGVDIWETKSRRRLHSLPEETGGVYWIAWSSDGGQLAVARSNGSITIWSLAHMARYLAQLDMQP